MVGSTRATRSSRRRPQLEERSSASEDEEADRNIANSAHSDADEASHRSKHEGSDDGEASAPEEEGAQPPSPAKTRSSTGRRRPRPQYQEADSDEGDDNSSTKSEEDGGTSVGSGEGGPPIPNKSSSVIDPGARSRPPSHGEAPDDGRKKRRRRAPSEEEGGSETARPGEEEGGSPDTKGNDAGGPPGEGKTNGEAEEGDGHKAAVDTPPSQSAMEECNGDGGDGTDGMDAHRHWDAEPDVRREEGAENASADGNGGGGSGAGAQASAPTPADADTAKAEAGSDGLEENAPTPPTSLPGEEEEPGNDGDSEAGTHPVEDEASPSSEPPVDPSSLPADNDLASPPSRIRSDDDSDAEMQDSDNGLCQSEKRDLAIKGEDADIPKDDGGDAIMADAPIENEGDGVEEEAKDVDVTHEAVGTGEAPSRIVSEETNASQSPDAPASMDVECSPSSEAPKELPASPEPAGLSLSIQYPTPTSRARPPPTAGQLKLALYLEASKAHRGRGPERRFAQYWEALERYIAMGSGRTRSGARASLESVEATLAGFLTTRKMKRLHNGLVLAVMQEALQTDVPSRCSAHVPSEWKVKATRSRPTHLSEDDVPVDANHNDRQLALQAWNADFGRCSGAWTAAKGGNATTTTDSSQAILMEHTGCSRMDDSGCDDAPSATLPGALEIEPLVRRRAASSGLMASDDAIWMLVIAAREHSASVIKRAIENEKDFASGYAPSLPLHSRTSLACQHLTVKGSEEASDPKPPESPKAGAKVINSTALMHVLAENHSVASRLMSMHAVVRLDERRLSSHHPSLDDVNGMINASIQRAAIRRRNAAPGDDKDLMATAAPTRANTTELGGSLPRSYQSQPLQASLPVGLPQNPATKPQTTNIAMQRRESIPVPPPVAPQPQLARAPLPAQNMQQMLHQVMNHSDHRAAAQPRQQPAVTMPNVDLLTKPGFPGMGSTSQSSEPAKSASPPTKTPSPPPRAGRRGSKDLAALRARPSPQPKPVGGEEAAGSGETNANGASAEGSKTAQSAAEEDGEAKEEKNDDAKESKTPSPTPSRGRGRGFGVKNLAAMRARSSFTEGGT
ncbi:hypothetical protein ACHAXT_011272 [Thalassiosira profunda]